MKRSDKLDLFRDFNQLFHYELSRIPYFEMEVAQKGKAESIAKEYYEEIGYDAYHSRVNNGYRSIGVEYYWQHFASKITEEDRCLIKKLKRLMTLVEFKELAYMVKKMEHPIFY